MEAHATWLLLEGPRVAARAAGGEAAARSRTSPDRAQGSASGETGLEYQELVDGSPFD